MRFERLYVYSYPLPVSTLYNCHMAPVLLNWHDRMYIFVMSLKFDTKVSIAIPARTFELRTLEEYGAALFDRALARLLGRKLSYHHRNA